jgi:hypothetical protein
VRWDAFSGVIMMPMFTLHTWRQCLVDDLCNIRYRFRSCHSPISNGLWRVTGTSSKEHFQGYAIFTSFPLQSD